MKNKFKIFSFLLIFLINFNSFLQSKELDIISKTVKVNENKVVLFKGDVVAIDEINNKIYTEEAIYNKLQKNLKTIGNTKIITSEGYEIVGKNILFDNDKKIISSSENTKIIDKDGNEFFVSMFNYMINKNMFFSKGEIQLIDIKKNDYYLSEIYIDEKKNKIVASDVRMFLNDNTQKINPDNEPRFFANSTLISKDKKEFNKGVFTYCKFNEGEKCPPWVLKSEKIVHDVSKKTIYYDNAVLKVYDFPIFYFPTLNHPDPTVKRRSGFLIPSFKGSSTTGSGLSAPYFWALNDDKDITLTPRFYVSHYPVILGEFRQDFKNSYLIVDSSFTQGFLKETAKKKRDHVNIFLQNFYQIFQITITREMKLNLTYST